MDRVLWYLMLLGCLALQARWVGQIPCCLSGTGLRLALHGASVSLSVPLSPLSLSTLESLSQSCHSDLQSTVAHTHARSRTCTHTTPDTPACIDSTFKIGALYPPPVYYRPRTM